MNPDSGDITGDTLNFNSQGQISSSTLAIDASDDVIVNNDYTGGSLAITGDGRITGQIQTSGGNTVEINGQMNANTDFAALHLFDTTVPVESAFAAAVLQD